MINKKVYVACALAALSLLSACRKKKQKPKDDTIEITKEITEEVTIETAAQERVSGPQIFEDDLK